MKDFYIYSMMLIEPSIFLIQKGILQDTFNDSIENQ